jgi:hypothetical protein
LDNGVPKQRQAPIGAGAYKKFDPRITRIKKEAFSKIREIRVIRGFLKQYLVLPQGSSMNEKKSNNNA